MATILKSAEQINAGAVIRYQENPLLDERVIASCRRGDHVFLTIFYSGIVQIDRYSKSEPLPIYYSQEPYERTAPI